MATKSKSKSKPEVEAVVEQPVVEKIEDVIEQPVAVADSSEKDLMASGGYFSKDGKHFFLPISKILGTADYISKAGNRGTYAIYRVDTSGYTLMPIAKSGKCAHSDVRKVGRATYVGFRVSADRLVPGTVKMK